jgi:hypothetical protein
VVAEELVSEDLAGIRMAGIDMTGATVLGFADEKCEWRVGIQVQEEFGPDLKG